MKLRQYNTKCFRFMTWLLKTIEIAAGTTWCPKTPRETRLTLHRLCDSRARAPLQHVNRSCIQLGAQVKPTSAGCSGNEKSKCRVRWRRSIKMHAHPHDLTRWDERRHPVHDPGTARRGIRSSDMCMYICCALLATHI